MPKLANNAKGTEARIIAEEEKAKADKQMKYERKELLRKFRLIWSSAGVQLLGVQVACMLGIILAGLSMLSPLFIFSTVPAKEMELFDCNMKGFVCQPQYKWFDAVILYTSVASIVLLTIIMYLLATNNGKASTIMSLIFGILMMFFYLFMIYMMIQYDRYGDCGVCGIMAFLFFSLFLFAIRNLRIFGLYPDTKSTLFDYQPDTRSLVYCFFWAFVILGGYSCSVNWMRSDLLSDARKKYENIGNEIHIVFDYLFIVQLSLNGLMAAFFLLQYFLFIPSIGAILPAQIFKHCALLYAVSQMSGYAFTMVLGFYQIASECLITICLMLLLCASMTAMLSKLTCVINSIGTFYRKQVVQMARDLVNYDPEIGLLIKPAPLSSGNTTNISSEGETDTQTMLPGTGTDSTAMKTMEEGSGPTTGDQLDRWSDNSGAMVTMDPATGSTN